jgi:aryl-alcohol dehydrogenase-like predicted oxidoreductase
MDAKRAGKIRYIGFTGHKDPHIHLYMLEASDRHGFRFDAAQLPVNVMDAHFRSFGNLVVPELVKRNIGVLGMKSMGDTVILKSGAVTPMECLHYALNMPTSVVITGIDKPEILEQAITAAQTFQNVTKEQIQAILAKTAKAGRNGAWELFKTSDRFDSTARNLEWLGGDSPHVQAVAPQVG